MQVIAGSIMASVLDFLFPADLFESALSRLLRGFSLWSCAVTKESSVTSSQKVWDGSHTTTERLTRRAGLLNGRSRSFLARFCGRI